MPRFAANLTMLFTEQPFLDRFAHARRAGFEAVEYLFPYPYEAADLKRRLDDNGLRQVLFNLPSGDWGAGDRGNGASPGREAEFREGVARAIDYAGVLGVPRLNCLAGKRVTGHSDGRHGQTLVENARFAAGELAKKGLELLVEPINHFDIPGFFVNRTADMSSIAPLASREIAAVLAEKGIEMLDAPVSGGQPKAIEGTLSVMVGGKKDVFDRCVPIFKTMAASVVRHFEKQARTELKRCPPTPA